MGEMKRRVSVRVVLSVVGVFVALTIAFGLFGPSIVAEEAGSDVFSGDVLREVTFFVA